MLGPQWFGVQGDYLEELASGTTTSATPCMKVREYASMVRPFRRHATNPLKMDDVAGLPDSRASPGSIDHMSGLNQNRSERTDQGCRASHTAVENQTFPKGPTPMVY